MESHDIVKQLLKQIPAKQIASELGVSLSLVYKWAEPPGLGSGSSNPLDRTEALARLAGSSVPLQWLCARLGGAFTPKGTPMMEDVQPLPAIGSLMSQLGQLLAEISVLAETDEITESRLSLIRQQWEVTKSCAEVLIQAAEQGRIATPGKPPQARGGAAVIAVIESTVDTTPPIENKNEKIPAQRLERARA